MNCAFVIGCTGQDGSYLTKSLIKQGFKVVGISRKKQPNLKNHKILNISDEIEIIENQLQSTTEFIELIRTYLPSEIYHLSAQSSVGLSFEQPLKTYKSIVESTNVVLESCRLTDYKGKIFLAGSSEIFGNYSKAISINSAQNGKSPYAISKKQSLLQADMYREIYDLKVVTGILFNHESPLRDVKFVTRKIVKEAVNIQSNQNKILKLGNIKVIRDWGWAEEYVEAMQLILRSKKLKNYLICTGKPNSLELFVKKVFDKLGLDYKDHVQFDKAISRKFDIETSYGDPSSLKQDLGWEAKKTFDDVIELLLENELKNKHFK